MLIRSYKKGDEIEILNLRKLVFGEKDRFKNTLKGWLWEYEGVKQQKPIIVVAEDRGKIIGHYGLIPIILTKGGKDYFCGLAVDLMVHPKYRRQGIFVNLYKEVETQAKREGMYGILGFPNQITLPTYTKKLGWEILGKLDVFLKTNFKFIISSIPSRFSGMKSLNQIIYIVTDKIKIKKITSFHDVTLSYTNMRSYYTLKREKNYLNWRYIEPFWYSYNCYKIVSEEDTLGYFVLRFLKKKAFYFAVLMDIFPFPVVNWTITQKIFNTIVEMCEKTGVAGLITSSPPNWQKTPFPMGIRVPRAFDPRPWYVGWKDLSGKLRISGTQLYLTFGDGDII